MPSSTGIVFSHTDDPHLIYAFRAFVHDNGMPGVRLTKESGEYVDVIFSVPAILELQKQLSQALLMAGSSSEKKQ